MEDTSATIKEQNERLKIVADKGREIMRSSDKVINRLELEIVTLNHRIVQTYTKLYDAQKEIEKLKQNNCGTALLKQWSDRFRHGKGNWPQKETDLFLLKLKESNNETLDI